MHDPVLPVQKSVTAYYLASELNSSASSAIKMSKGFTDSIVLFQNSSGVRTLLILLDLSLTLRFDSIAALLPSRPVQPR